MDIKIDNNKISIYCIFVQPRYGRCTYCDYERGTCHEELKCRSVFLEFLQMNPSILYCLPSNMMVIDHLVDLLMANIICSE